MERNLNQGEVVEDRRFFTEGPFQQHQEDNMSNSSDEIDPKQLQALMMNPKFAAIFQKNLNQEGVEIFQDDEQEDYDFIDLNNLPNDQEQFFCQDDFNEDQDNDYSEYHGMKIQFNEDDVDQEDDDAVDSNYGDDIIEVYQYGGNEEDIKNYKRIHLMDKDYGDQHIEEGEKFQCPDTGAHFEYLDMCHRLKKLQVKRSVVDKVFEEEEKRKAFLKLQEIENINVSKDKSTRTSEKKSVIQQLAQQQSHAVSQNNEERSKRLKTSELKDVENLIQAIQQPSTQDNYFVCKDESQDIVQKIRQSKVHKTKDNFVGQPLPTENNLITEEGGVIGNSFSNYMGQFNTQDYRVQKTSGNSSQLAGKKSQNKERQLIETIVQQQKQIELENLKQQKVNHTLWQGQQMQQHSKDVSHNQEDILSYCTTETRDAPDKKKIRKSGGQGACNTKQIQLNNFFSNESSNRNPQQVPSFDNRTQLQMEALALNKEIINRQIQAQNVCSKVSNQSTSKPRENSQNNSKMRNQSHGAQIATSSKGNQIQKLLMNFYKNQAQNSRSSNSKNLHIAIENSSRKKIKEPNQQTIGPKIVIGSAEKIPKHPLSNYNHTTQTNNEYQTVSGTLTGGGKKITTSKVKKFKINKGGLMARGNTIDNRISDVVKPTLSNAQSYPTGSHSTTVGVSSHNASRPGSAIKKKQITPSNKLGKQSLLGNHPELKQLLLLKGKSELKTKKEKHQYPIVILNKSKDQVVAHKKTQSVNPKNVLKNKIKNNLAIMSLDQNSLALEEILKHNIETSQDIQYQTYHQGADLGGQKARQKVSNLLNSAYSNKSRQKSHNKISVCKSRQKQQDIQKTSFGAKSTLTNHLNPDQIKLDINSIIKKLSIKQVNPNPLAQKQASKNKHAKSHHQTQLSSVSHGMVASSIQTEDKKVSRTGTESKRYNSTKDSCRDNTQINNGNGIRAGSKDSKSRAQHQQNKHLRMSHQPTNSNGAAPVVKPTKELQLNQQQMSLLTGSSYDFRSERCETVA